MTQAGPDETIWHYDGTSATRHHPVLEWTAETFTLRWGLNKSGPHRWGDLVPVDGSGGRSIYGLRGQHGWRLGFTGAPPQDFAIHLPLPARYGRWIDRVGLWRALALFAVIAAGVVYAVLRAPDWIAPHVPLSWEQRLGDAMIGDFGGRLCQTPQSRAALDKLQRKLGEDVPIRRIGIANVTMVNAVALPGGHILLFDQLIQDAQSSDEVAGILAHEIGHVRNRDTMTALIRQFGLSIVLGGFGGDLGNTANGLLSLSYGRDAERAADSYSIGALQKADISPLPTAAFFKRLGGGDGGEQIERAANLMASHPISAERRKAFEASARKGHRYEAALTPAEWRAIVNACKDDKDVAPASRFPF
ncbi:MULTISPECIES: M48 family metallopeptidase [unclassified Sphingobium]|uniref:M48 family metallopeptidase n=1 Tax=unclassified Sphingobium TaxID=2611147 RepID=UPI0022253825|nr:MULTISPECIES: M48 family metallopeptidase [unclassified Sphingobium]MCW2393653.1 Zn-dependent protease with chaperone function [Sphingobium sp. B8D3B]MCW2417166.1 Zn-dependent protease with chaperone function [Sphingobium sp. B8D3C]